MPRRGRFNLSHQAQLFSEQCITQVAHAWACVCRIMDLKGTMWGAAGAKPTDFLRLYSEEIHNPPRHVWSAERPRTGPNNPTNTGPLVCLTFISRFPAT